MTDFERLTTATAHLDPPLLALDAPALAANADDLLRRAAGTPIRIATKSVRSRAVLTDLLRQPGFAGLMTYSLAEAVWLAGLGMRDLLMGYPSADRAALRKLPEHASAITLMVDDVAQLDLIRDCVPRGRPVRVCLDVDASLRIGRAHLGVRRSPIRTPAEAVRLARQAVTRGMTVVGVMFYEAQIAGLPDSSAAVRWVKRRSGQELGQRRGEVVAAVQDAIGPLELVNGGGTGSVQLTRLDPAITEVTAGSGLYAPTLFDGYRAFTPTPALFMALPVVRRPAEKIATLFGGGYIASGPAGGSRVPRPVWPDALTLLRGEGAGEVQTPVRGRAAHGLAVGDRVWLRPAKAGEVTERFAELHLVDVAGAVRSVTTYRGEGRCFG